MIYGSNVISKRSLLLKNKLKNMSLNSLHNAKASDAKFIANDQAEIGSLPSTVCSSISPLLYCHNIVTQAYKRSEG